MKKTRLHVTILSFCALFGTAQVYADAHLINGFDSNVNAPLKQAKHLVSYQNKLYFSADGGNQIGRELYVFDQASGETSLVADIYKGSASSNPMNLVIHDHRVFFSADDGVHGTELHSLDLQTGELKLAKDIFKGSQSGFPWRMTSYEGSLYFSAANENNQRQFYVLDKHSDDIRLIYSFENREYGGMPSEFAVYKGKLYFAASSTEHGRELYSYDLISDSVSLVDDIAVGEKSSYPRSLTLFNDKLYFSALSTSGSGVFCYSEALNKVEKVADLKSKNAFTNLSAGSDRLYFTIHDKDYGPELFSLNTDDNIHLELDAYPGNRRSYLDNLFSVDDSLYFVSEDGTDGTEIMRLKEGTLSVSSDLTRPESLKDYPSSYDFYRTPRIKEFTRLDNQLYFTYTESLMSPNKLYTITLSQDGK